MNGRLLAAKFLPILLSSSSYPEDIAIMSSPGPDLVPVGLMRDCMLWQEVLAELILARPLWLYWAVYPVNWGFCWWQNLYHPYPGVQKLPPAFPSLNEHEDEWF